MRIVVHHFVFCRDGCGISGNSFIDRCEETVAFEEFDFEPSIVESEMEWTVVDVIYDHQKRPIQFARYIDADCRRFVDMAIATLAERGFQMTSNDLLVRLKETRQVFVIEFNELLADEDVWEFLDIIETHLASERDGVIFSVDEGFFDEDNKPIRAFQ